MKKYRTILIVLGIIVLLPAPMLIVDIYKARKCAQEVTRMYQVRSVVEQKLEAYQKANGRYPDSLNVFSFTNSPQEREMLTDLKKIRYRLTKTDYAVGWEGEYSWSR